MRRLLMLALVGYFLIRNARVSTTGRTQALIGQPLTWRFALPVGEAQLVRVEGVVEHQTKESWGQSIDLKLDRPGDEAIPTKMVHLVLNTSASREATSDWSRRRGTFPNARAGGRGVSRAPALHGMQEQEPDYVSTA